MTPQPIDNTRPSFSAFLSLGFRPLYMAGAAWAAISVGIWIFAPEQVAGKVAGVWWHAHEMLWGFVATIALGFLTTASATWTGVNPIRGRALGSLLLCWLLARLCLLIPGQGAFILALLSSGLVYLLAFFTLSRVIFLAKNRRNYILPWAVLALGVTDCLYLMAAEQGMGRLLLDSLRIGLLCMVFIALLIARRVIPFFAMRAIPGLRIPMHTRSGLVQLLACLAAMVAVAADAPRLLATGTAVAGLIALFQLWRWQPLRVLRTPLLWVLYLAYFFLGLGLALAAGHFAGIALPWLAVRATYVHVIAMGGFSIMIMGMMTRTALGHTGRPLTADRLVVGSYWLVLVATLARLAALGWPAWHMPGLVVATTAWIVGFGLYLYRFAPLLLAPRPSPPDSGSGQGRVIRLQEKPS